VDSWCKKLEGGRWSSGIDGGYSCQGSFVTGNDWRGTSLRLMEVAQGEKSATAVDGGERCYLIGGEGTYGSRFGAGLKMDHRVTGESKAPARMGPAI